MFFFPGLTLSSELEAMSLVPDCQVTGRGPPSALSYLEIRLSDYSWSPWGAEKHFRIFGSLKDTLKSILLITKVKVADLRA